MHRPNARLLTGVAVMLVGIAGCGDNTPVALPSTGATLEGTAKYDGKTLHFGIVQVEAGATSAQGQISQDGTYKVDNVPIGDVKIAVITDPGMARAAQMQAGAYRGPDAKGANKVNVEYVEVPKKFHDVNTSGLSFKTEKGTNKYDIEMKK